MNVSTGPLLTFDALVETICHSSVSLLTILLTANKIILHYTNMSMQYTALFHGNKNDNFQVKKM